MRSIAHPMGNNGIGSIRLVSLTGVALLLLATGLDSARAQEAGQPEAADESGTDEWVADDIPPVSPDANLPEVETIITREEFEEAVPALSPEDDPELDRPLESLEEFERRFAGETAEGAPADRDLSALQEGAAIGEAPILDAELAKPLPPIGEFQVEKVEFAEEASDRKAVEVAYELKIDGLKQADGQTEAHLLRMFNDFSALRDGDGKAANYAMVTARLEEDAELMHRILASEGWYAARVSTRIDRSGAKDGKPLIAALDVTPGKRFSFSDIVIDAQPTEPPDLIRNSLALKVGEPIIADRVQGAEAQVAVNLPQAGYPFTEIGQRDILLDRRSGQGVYTLPVDTGPRSRFGGITTKGDEVFDADHVGVLARFRRGELYDSRKIDDLRKALVATGLFATVSVEPQRSGETDQDGTEYATIEVGQSAGPPRTIAGSVGYGTGEGASIEGSWTHHNMFPPEGALIVRGVAGTNEQGAGVTFRRSNAGKRDRTFEIAAEALHSNFDAYSAYTGSLSARISRDSTPIWQKRLTYAYGGVLLATAEKDYDFDKGERSRNTYYVAGLNGQLGVDYTDSLLDPTRGFRVTSLLEPEAAINGGFNVYVRSRFDASAYASLGSGIVAAARFRLGSIQGAPRSEIAPSRRFYSGGGGSVRGYAYQSLGPQDPDGDPIGGRSLNEASAELRYRFGAYGIVGFVDVGQSYRSTMPQFSDLRVGAGIGGRFYTNFGPMRVDVATPISRRPGESRINVYVSIGQAF